MPSAPGEHSIWFDMYSDKIRGALKYLSADAKTGSALTRAPPPPEHMGGGTHPLRGGDSSYVHADWKCGLGKAFRSGDCWSPDAIVTKRNC